MAERWLIDSERCWIWRFHRDDASWVRGVRVFMGRGRVFSDGSPPLLKERRCLRLEDAQAKWRTLLAQGWQPLEKPAWGAGVDV